MNASVIDKSNASWNDSSTCYLVKGKLVFITHFFINFVSPLFFAAYPNAFLQSQEELKKKTIYLLSVHNSFFRKLKTLAWRYGPEHTKTESAYLFNLGCSLLSERGRLVIHIGRYKHL